MHATRPLDGVIVLAINHSIIETPHAAYFGRFRLRVLHVLPSLNAIHEVPFLPVVPIGVAQVIALFHRKNLAR